MKKYLFIFSTFLISCTEEITPSLSQANEQLVVEGSIEPGFAPYVILTTNQGYFDPINQNTYINSFVNSEDVDSIKVWYYDEDGETISKSLKRVPIEISEALISEAIPLYTIADSLELYDMLNNPGQYEFSQAGRTYYLEIQWNNQVITAQTTIPESTPLDCLWVEKSENADKDFKCDIRAVYSDPANVQNNVLISSKRLQHYERNNNLQCMTVNNPDLTLTVVDAGSDILIDGETFETIFPRPENNSFPTGKYNSYHTKECDDGSILEFPEDIVLIKFCQIDESSMKFWRSMVRQFTTNGTPFSEPLNLVSNINNGLGVWTGYGSVYYKIRIIEDIVITEQYPPEIQDIF